MRGKNEPRAVAQRVLDGGQGFADARVVHDAAVVERDVKVDAHENAVVVERKIADGKFGHEGTLSVRRSLFADRCSQNQFGPYLRSRSAIKPN